MPSVDRHTHGLRNNNGPRTLLMNATFTLRVPLKKVVFLHRGFDFGQADFGQATVGVQQRLQLLFQGLNIVLKPSCSLTSFSVRNDSAIYNLLDFFSFETEKVEFQRQVSVCV